jgi:hypothetical protein
MTPEAVRALAEEVYNAAGPLLGCHSPCRELGCIALGIAAAWGLDAELRYDASYTERGHTDQHFWIEFADGARLDRWSGLVRLRAPR